MKLIFNHDGKNVKETFLSNRSKYVTAVLAFTEDQLWNWRKDLDPSGKHNTGIKGGTLGFPSS